MIKWIAMFCNILNEVLKMIIKKVVLLDIVKIGNPYVESVGMGSIASLIRQNDYQVLLCSYLEGSINFGQIIDFNPDVVAFSIHHTTFNKVKEACKIILSYFPKIFFIAGGYYATYNYAKILNESLIHFVVRGEGEITFLHLLNALNKNEDLKTIDGISYISKKSLIVNVDREFVENLDSLPYPARDVMVQHNLAHAAIDGARGCSNNCSFCSLQQFWKQGEIKYRSRSIKSIVCEIEYIINNYNVHSFSFLDCSYENPFYNILDSSKLQNI
jgi:radical SAM superfamily enzyme YgiQ (UPF0313 family)